MVPALHSPFLPVKHATPTPLVPAQVPPVHTSTVVQPFWSSHDVPLLLLSYVHAPVVAAQLANVWHWSGVQLHAEQVAEPVVAANVPGSHGLQVAAPVLDEA